MLTGATGGVGQATARRLAREGAELVLIGRRAGALTELAAELGAWPVVGDVTDAGFTQGLAAETANRWEHGPDVLINNAGAFQIAPASETEPSEFERIVSVNLVAPFTLIRAWLPAMLGRGSGHVISVGSVAGRQAFPGNAAYSASKYGLRGLHEVLVAELRGSGLRVTWIEPSAIDTPLWDPYDPDRRSDLPSRAQMLKPAAVAEAICFAISQPAEVVVEEIVIRANPVGGGGRVG